MADRLTEEQIAEFKEAFSQGFENDKGKTPLNANPSNQQPPQQPPSVPSRGPGPSLTLRDLANVVSSKPGSSSTSTLSAPGVGGSEAFWTETAGVTTTTDGQDPLGLGARQSHDRHDIAAGGIQEDELFAREQFSGFDIGSDNVGVDVDPDASIPAEPVRMIPEAARIDVDRTVADLVGDADISQEDRSILTDFLDGNFALHDESRRIHLSREQRSAGEFVETFLHLEYSSRRYSKKRVVKKRGKLQQQQEHHHDQNNHISPIDGDAVLAFLSTPTYTESIYSDPPATRPSVIQSLAPPAVRATIQDGEEAIAYLRERRYTDDVWGLEQALEEFRLATTAYEETLNSGADQDQAEETERRVKSAVERLKMLRGHL